MLSRAFSNQQAEEEPLAAPDFFFSSKESFLVDGS